MEEKKMKSNLKKLAAVSALSLVLVVPFATAQEKLPCQGMNLPAKDAKALIASAKTAEDHQKLACYFSAEARNEEERAKYHDEMAKLYENNSNSKRDMVGHCKHFADEARKAAESDNQLAAEHEKMAEQAK
jgi:hypothetical protein